MHDRCRHHQCPTTARIGETFVGWQQTWPTVSGTNDPAKKFTIPANSQGHIELTAVWNEPYVELRVTDKDEENNPTAYSITFKYGVKPATAPDGVAKIFSIPTTAGTPDWAKTIPYYSRITKVEFDPSFADARPVSCAYWFYTLSSLAEIEGINY
ncbi:MAG: hypothetical protein II075_08295, partial [Bacteroidales bacterium]|nr:hypothetical protein [Bacteroidales bacterium]